MADCPAARKAQYFLRFVNGLPKDYIEYIRLGLPPKCKDVDKARDICMQFQGVKKSRRWWLIRSIIISHLIESFFLPTKTLLSCFYSPLVVFLFYLIALVLLLFYKSPFKYSVLQSPKTNWAPITASNVTFFFIYIPAQNSWPHSGKTLLSCCYSTSRTVSQQFPHP